MKNHLIPGLCAILALAWNANAATFAENFESYTTGSNLHGQNGWKGWDNDIAGGALVSTDFAASPSRSVKITGASDLVRTFSGMTSGTWEFKVKQFVPAGFTGITYFILLNQYNDGGPYNWSVQIQHDGAKNEVVSDLGNEAKLPLVKNQWVDYRFVIDLDASTVSEYYNDQLLSTHPWHDGTGLNELAAVDLYANSVGPVYYDDIKVGPPDVVITLSQSGSSVTLSWASGTLLESESLDPGASWTPVTDAAAPSYTFTVPTTGAKYYRVQTQ